MSPWSEAALADVCRIVGGGTPSRSNADFYGGSIPWITPKDMKVWEISGAQVSITQAGLDNSATRLVPADSVLIVVRSGVLKHTVPVALSRVPAAINQDMKALLCGNRVVPAFLARFIKAQSPAILKWVRATTADNFPIDNLKALTVPLPPLPEQKRIAAILDKADEMRAKRRAALAELDTLAQSIFLEMFGDPVANPKGWPETACLGEVADIVSGVTKGRKLNGRSAREVPYLAVANVQDRALNLSAVKTIEATEEEIERYRLERDDLLLTEGGDPDKLGRGTLWSEELPECIHQNHVFRVRLTTSTVQPLFLNWLVGSQRGKKYFLRSAKQTTGIASINMTQLRGFRLLVPPVSLQRTFAAGVAAVEKLTAAHRASLAELDALFASLQHRAFRGEL
ncbi:MAG: restriction endonuclease subunit S [Deferrisomatales bacterium]|nr:restriction endonuclease subunit S [Deferrisomatales bacterium]